MSKKFVFGFALVLVVVFVLIWLTSVNVLSLYNGKILLKSNAIDKVEEEHYVNEYLDLKVVKAEGKFVLALSILDPDIIVYFNDGTVKSIMSELTEKPIFDELRELESIQILIYKKEGFIFRESIGSFSFGDVDDISEYSTIDEAREALK